MPAVSVFSATLGAASSVVTFDVAGPWRRMYLQIPTFTSISALAIKVSDKETGTYYPFMQEVPQTTTVQCWPYTIAATATSGGAVVPLPVGSFRYFTITATDSAPAAAMGFKVICSNNV